MKKFLMAGLIGLAFLVSGCGGSSSGHTNTVSANSTNNVDAAFVHTIRGQLNADGVTDTDLVSLGHNICHAFDNGASFLTVGNVATSNGFSDYDAGFLMGASIAAYCPQYENLIPSSS